MNLAKVIFGTLFAILVGLLVVLSTGCASYRGLIPGKDAQIEDFEHTVTTPWGSAVTKAKKIKTTVSDEEAPK